MKPVSSDEMRRLDRAAIEEFHIPAILLMENAGRSVADLIARDHKPCRAAIFIGKGNNGGDGLVTARHLSNRGFEVLILMLEDPAKLKPDPLANYQAVEKMHLPVRRIGEGFPGGKLVRIASGADLIVDAIFGIGLKSDLRGIFDTAVRAINEAARFVVSIDIPSGLDADSGEIHGVAVKANVTAALALSKTGLVTGKGPACAGKIEIVDIGIPRNLLRPYLD